MVEWNGLTERSIRASGETVFNTEKVKQWAKMGFGNKDTGKMEKELVKNDIF